MKKILATLLLAAVFLSGAGFTAYTAEASFRVVQTPVYHLYTGESGTATTARITPYPTDLDGVKLTMTDFGTTPTVTIDPGLKNIEEIESFTGITDNGDNTATLTGLSRDLASKYPYTTAGTGRTHGSGATIVFGNNPQIYGRLAALENPNTWSAVQTFASTSQPVYDGNPSFSNPLALPDIAYVLGVAISGAGTSTENTMGIVRLATFGQVGTGIASSTSGAPYVIENKFASSTYNGSTVFQGEIPALRSSFNIDPNFIATSSGNNYVWGGIQNFNATTTVTGAGGLQVSATSTFTGTTTMYGVTALSRPGQMFMSATTTVNWPVPIVVSTSTGLISTGSSLLASSTIGFVGFTQGLITAGVSAFVQTSGIVSGFVGLSIGSDYYLQDNGTVGTSVGTNEMYVGTAISSTQLVLEAPRSLQYVGSVALSGSPTGSATLPAYVREVVVKTDQSAHVDGDITLFRNGKTSGIVGWDSITGGASEIGANNSCSISGNTISCSAVYTNGGVNQSPTITATAYYYR